MMRATTILWVIIAAIVGLGLYTLKNEVKALEEDLAQINHKIADSRESIHVIKAEWSFLNDPERLREQAERHLGLKPIKPAQLTTFDALPMAPADQPPRAPQPAVPAPVAEDQEPAMVAASRGTQPVLPGRPTTPARDAKLAENGEIRTAAVKPPPPRAKPVVLPAPVTQAAAHGRSP